MIYGLEALNRAFPALGCLREDKYWEHQGACNFRMVLSPCGKVVRGWFFWTRGVECLTMELVLGGTFYPFEFGSVSFPVEYGWEMMVPEIVLCSESPRVA